jgi:hypothetical protein
MSISWEAKRRNAIKRLLAVLDKYKDGDDESEDNVTKAVDKIAVAHIAASCGWELNSVSAGLDKRTATIDRLVEAWQGYNKVGGDDPEAEERLQIALDALTLAHVTYTFEWASGPRKW